MPSYKSGDQSHTMWALYVSSEGMLSFSFCIGMAELCFNPEYIPCHRWYLQKAVFYWAWFIFGFRFNFLIFVLFRWNWKKQSLVTCSNSYSHLLSELYIWTQAPNTDISSAHSAIPPWLFRGVFLMKTRVVSDLST